MKTEYIVPLSDIHILGHHRPDLRETQSAYALVLVGYRVSVQKFVDNEFIETVESKEFRLKDNETDLTAVEKEAIKYQKSVAKHYNKQQ